MARAERARVDAGAQRDAAEHGLGDLDVANLHASTAMGHPQRQPRHWVSNRLKRVLRLARQIENRSSLADRTVFHLGLAIERVRPGGHSDAFEQSVALTRARV